MEVSVNKHEYVTSKLLKGKPTVLLQPSDTNTSVM